jgi:hypothetical protein
VGVVDVKMCYFAVMTYSDLSMCLDSRVDVRVLAYANPLALCHLMEMASIVLLLRHSTLDPVSEEMVPPKAMACLVAHLDASICSVVNVLHSNPKSVNVKTRSCVQSRTVFKFVDVAGGLVFGEFQAA